VRRVPASREPDRLADAAKPLPPFLGLAKTRGQITPVGRRCRFFPSVGKDGTAKILLNQSLEPIKLADGQPAERLDELGVRAEALLDGAGCGSAPLGPSLRARGARITRVTHRHLFPPLRDVPTRTRLCDKELRILAS
jgi:hypothetical protein